MIVKDVYAIRKDGEVLYRTFSDGGFYIIRDGIKFEDAVDPASAEREYLETNETIPTPHDLEEPEQEGENR